MSIKLLNIAFLRVQGISPTQKLVLSFLSYKADDDGFCATSLSDIAQFTCLSKNAVIKALKALREMGLIKKVSDADPRFCKPNEYQVMSCNI